LIGHGFGNNLIITTLVGQPGSLLKLVVPIGLLTVILVGFSQVVLSLVIVSDAFKPSPDIGRDSSHV
jgi:hypothetical protein